MQYQMPLEPMGQSRARGPNPWVVVLVILSVVLFTTLVVALVLCFHYHGCCMAEVPTTTTTAALTSTHTVQTIDIGGVKLELSDTDVRVLPS
ncbi:MAG: uncharacterized protein KVP18_001923 [Porospora cf. gigantea A]|uniref:uncharacterized protein n=1 Tax=Porospora cf. gigantea A TaxID=2853593 RepID=UPI00355A4751|nr:MAG: hypothetical protein KVP18_001923 [Porospora cf. gigantea A]